MLMSRTGIVNAHLNVYHLDGIANAHLYMSHHNGIVNAHVYVMLLITIIIIIELFSCLLQRG